MLGLLRQSIDEQKQLDVIAFSCKRWYFNQVCMEIRCKKYQLICNYLRDFEKNFDVEIENYRNRKLDVKKYELICYLSFVDLEKIKLDLKNID